MFRAISVVNWLGIASIIFVSEGLILIIDFKLFSARKMYSYYDKL